MKSIEGPRSKFWQWAGLAIVAAGFFISGFDAPRWVVAIVVFGRFGAFVYGVALFGQTQDRPRQ